MAVDMRPLPAYRVQNARRMAGLLFNKVLCRAWRGTIRQNSLQLSPSRPSFRTVYSVRYVNFDIFRNFVTVDC